MSGQLVSELDEIGSSGSASAGRILALVLAVLFGTEEEAGAPRFLEFVPVRLGAMSALRSPANLLVTPMSEPARADQMRCALEQVPYP